MNGRRLVDRLAPGQVVLPGGGLSARHLEHAARHVRCARFGVALALALGLIGCGGSKQAPPSADVPPPPATQTPGSEPPPTTVPSTPPGAGTVTAPWDTAARSRESRRNHVYPRGESEIGRKLVAALPDPGGLPANEGGPAPTPPAPAPGTSTPTTTPTTPTIGDCWQVQLVATGDRARAERVKSEAEALLGVQAEIVSKDGTLRVRAGGACLDPEAALRLVDRARREGWPEAFRVRGGS
jgi:sporulation related protein